MHKAFAALEPPRQQALADELTELLTTHNRSGDGTLMAPSDYLEVVITVA